MRLPPRAATITTVYAVAGTAWILGSDALVAFLAPPDWIPALQLGKGLAFIAVTAALLYVALHRSERYRSLVGEHAQAQRRVEQLRNLYAALSSANQAIMRVASREELFEDVCRTVVARADVEMAWIGTIEPETRWVRPQAWAGDERAARYLARIRVSADGDRPEGRGPIGRAVRGEELVIFEDFQNDPDAAPWRQQAREAGYAAVAAAPIYEEGAVVGALAVYAARSGYFNDEVLGLLEELAADISYALDRFRLQEHTHYLATHDLTTGLLNRNALLERVEAALARWRRLGGWVAVVFIDLDGFKPVNDRYGHAAGDVLLAEVGRRLTAITREMDSVCRQGGDEFVILLPRIEGPEEAELVGSRVLEALARPYELEQGRAQISASIGISLCPEHGDSAEALIHAADTAMYAAKAGGRGRLCLYDPEISGAPARPESEP